MFADFQLAEGKPEPLVMPAGCLGIRLGGLSKSAGLPQVKLGWMALSGPDDVVERVRPYLELIADTYLPVSTPVQIAAPELIAGGAAVRAQILGRIRRNYQALRAAAAAYPAIEILRIDGGWSATVRVPATRSEEDLTLDLVEKDGVLVHPGFFFDFAHEAFVIVSLLPQPADFDEGVRRLLERAHA